MQKTVNKKGQLSGGAWALISTVLALVVVGILLSVGLLTNTKVAEQIDRDDFTAAQNTTYDSIQTTNLESYELTSTGQTILAAMAILTIVVGVVYLFSGKGG